MSSLDNFGRISGTSQRVYSRTSKRATASSEKFGCQRYGGGVNFVSPSTQEPVTAVLDVARFEPAAKTIQQWYRRVIAKRSEANQQIKDMLKKKQFQRASDMRLSRSIANQQRKAKETSRSEKERMARLAAIEELKRKREEKQIEQRKKAEQEMVYLEASGKVRKQPVKWRTGKATGKQVYANSRSRLQQNKKQIQPTVDKVTEVMLKTTNEESEPTETALEETAALDGESQSDAHSITSVYSDMKSQTSSHSTLHEALKLLEAEPEPLEYPNATNHQTSELSQWMDNKGGLSSGKLGSILDFLAEVERENPSPIPSDLSRRSMVVEEDTQKELDAVSAVTADIASTMCSQKEALDVTRKRLGAVEREIDEQRQLNMYQMQQQQREHKHKLTLQKQEYEQRLEGLQKVIDQLVDQNEKLSAQCESLLQAMKSTDQKYTRKIHEMEESHARELKRQKDIDAAAEKLRREKWIDEKTKQIKDMTVQGLEPEIQRLISKHKTEMKRVSVIHQDELARADERASSRFVQQTEDLREQLAREKEAACQRERELARQRYEKQAEQDEMALQKERRRLHDEVEHEKQRLADMVRQQKQEIDGLKSKLQTQYEEKFSAIDEDKQRALEELERRHKSELRELNERLTIEKTAWQENMIKKQDDIFATRERELRESMRKERDKEIEMVIQHLEAETRHNQEDMEKTTETRIRRVREKYESELKELEQSEKSTRQKFSKMKDQVLESQSSVSQLELQLKRKERELEDCQEVSSRLTNERDHMADIIRQEFVDRLVATEEESKRMKSEMSEMKARHKVEMEQVTKDKESELNEIHDRVKLALAKKEEAIKSMREQYQAAVKRSEHFEMLLKRQRQELTKLQS
ncbi:centrosomal protein of 131 kDa-like [Corticium candelabrum]|uniref:centrosomal protein of 131 kDa-like n=1 Tax=Corticium candelabrum TaxID=121492 RepID=UPI002E26B149|nr:centrosomal protein of 131 kDa-like [Corticium candelabrum]